MDTNDLDKPQEKGQKKSLTSQSLKLCYLKFDCAI